MPPIPIFLLTFIILLAVFRYKNNKSTMTNKARIEAFWERERQARFSRKKDISHLETIQVDFAALPFVDTKDPKLREIQKNVRKFENKTMMNLSHIDNTEIKMEYGAANFPLLSQYDQNYLIFSRHLYEWGQYLYDSCEYEKARTLLELTLSQGTDISGVYVLLAKLYKSNQELDKIRHLIALAEELTTLMKPKILKELSDILNSQ